MYLPHVWQMPACLIVLLGPNDIFYILSLRQNDRRFRKYILKCIFLNDNMRISIKISLKFVSMTDPSSPQ